MDIPEDQCCHSPNNRVLIETVKGNIANSVTENTGCGTIDCPWVLQAPKGQIFNISVYDFALPPLGKLHKMALWHGNALCFVGPYQWNALLDKRPAHYNDVIMSAMASQITSLTIVYSTVYSGADQRNTSKFRVTGLCEVNSNATGGFPSQRASNA